MTKFTIGQRVALRLAAADALGVGLDVQILDKIENNTVGNIYRIETLNGGEFFPWSEIFCPSSIWIREIDLTDI